ncbi:MAG: radical SAM protein [Myxococcota bacterium]|nr:radical SAM protein [Myxococcota bacterium]
MTLPLREHTFLGTTQSLCPDCLRVVPAKIVDRGGRVYFLKRCPEHGERADFVCSDVTQYDQLRFSVPGKIPASFGAEVDRGCPLDCGLCPDHEQHTCLGLVELTSACNLKCPMCYASSGPDGRHEPLEAVLRSIDRLVEVEGRPEVLQLSGGEPTVHPRFAEILRYAVDAPIDVVMVNTNGVTLARDDALLDLLTEHRRRIEVYLQLDAFDDEASRALRGAELTALKLRAVERLGERGVRTTLVSTLQPGVNDHSIGEVVRFAVARPWITGVSFQPATYSGRHVTPEDLERRITYPDVVRLIEEQTDGMFVQDDFMPLPCAHPNCHTLTYAYRHEGAIHPLLRFMDARDHLDLLANGIALSRPRGRALIESYLKVKGCADDGCSGLDAFLGALGELPALPPVARDFFERALRETLDPEDVFRITITSFLDAYNFDVRRVMKCCIHHVLPSGHVIPFCAYNVLYREGHVALPRLVDAGIAQPPEGDLVTLGKRRGS